MSTNTRRVNEGQPKPKLYHSCLINDSRQVIGRDFNAAKSFPVIVTNSIQGFVIMKQENFDLNIWLTSLVIISVCSVFESTQRIPPQKLYTSILFTFVVLLWLVSNY